MAQNKEKTDKNVCLLLIGDGDYLSLMKKKYNSPSNNIVFYGYSGNPIPLIKICNVGLLPTYYKGESLPNTVIEYLNLSLPVIGSDIGEIANMIGAGTDRGAGVVIPRTEQGPVDHIIWAQHMEEYANKESVYVRHKRKTNCQNYKFDMQNCASAYERFFQELLN